MTVVTISVMLETGRHQLSLWAQPDMEQVNGGSHDVNPNNAMIVSIGKYKLLSRISTKGGTRQYLICYAHPPLPQIFSGIFFLTLLKHWHWVGTHIEKYVCNIRHLTLF